MTKLIDFNFFIQVNNIFTACSFYHLCSVGGANTIVLAERKLLEPDPDNTGVGKRKPQRLLPRVSLKFVLHRKSLCLTLTKGFSRWESFIF